MEKEDATSSDGAERGMSISASTGRRKNKVPFLVAKVRRWEREPPTFSASLARPPSAETSLLLSRLLRIVFKPEICGGSEKQALSARKAIAKPLVGETIAENHSNPPCT